MIVAANVTILILSTLVLAGGILGFVRAKSKASLIAGLISSLLLDGSFAISICYDARSGLILADALTFLLFMFGSIRFRKSRKYMPGGLLVTLTCLALIVITLALVWM